ncbi:MAG: GNAT family N-acetyltransferase, partial [Solirubrobacterales bacterium]|nr:GNAT family N-acetyltransferase [Solirubrobacterales bacterium]
MAALRPTPASSPARPIGTLHAGGELTDAIVIRTAHDGDRDFIVTLVPSLLEFGSPIWQDVNGLSPSFSDVLVQAVVERDPRAAVLVAETAESTRLGFISLSSKTLSGAGRALMGAAKGWARDRGLGILSLDVWATNHRGLAFYRALGTLRRRECDTAWPWRGRR